jgi:hypothetical protein
MDCIVQATLGKNDGLSSGIIDAYQFSELLDAIALLVCMAARLVPQLPLTLGLLSVWGSPQRLSRAFPADVDNGVRGWFRDFGAWLQSSGRSRCVLGWLSALSLMDAHT